MSNYLTTLIEEFLQLMVNVGAANWLASFVGLLMHYFFKWEWARTKVEYTFKNFWAEYRRAIILSIICSITMLLGLVGQFPDDLGSTYNIPLPLPFIKFGASTLIGYANTSLWLNLMRLAKSNSFPALGFRKGKKKRG